MGLLGEFCMRVISIRYLKTFFILVVLSGLIGCQRVASLFEELRRDTETDSSIQGDADFIEDQLLTIDRSQPPLNESNVTPSVDEIPTRKGKLYSIAGIEMYNIRPSGGLEQVINTETYWIRRNGLMWSEVEPEQGTKKWEVLKGLEDELVNAARKSVEVILVVRSTPNWAQEESGVFCGQVAPESLTAFADFMHEAVARYSIPPFNVKYWELGNEPDIDPDLVPPDSPFGCWGDKGDPYYGGDYYAEMLKLVYPKIKEADPESQVLIGGLLMVCDPNNPPETSPGSGEKKDCTATRFLQGIVKNGGGDYFDEISFHAYDYYLDPFEYGNLNWANSWDSTGPMLVKKTQFIRNILADYGYSDKFLMNTEGSLLCGKDGKEPECQSESFYLTKAYYVAKSNASAIAEGLRANIWFSLTGWRGLGLINRELQPNPAYDAYRFSAEKLKKVTFEGELDHFPDVKGYEFSKGETRIWFIWSLNSDEHVIQLTNIPNPDEPEPNRCLFTKFLLFVQEFNC